MVELKPNPGDKAKYGIPTVASSNLVPDSTKTREDKGPTKSEEDIKIWGFRTPTLYQHMMMPWSNPPRTPGSTGNILNDPKLESLK